MNYKINKGSHYSGFRFKPMFYFKNKIIKGSFNFKTSPFISGDHINKLFGISFGMHHTNSFRFGQVANMNGIDIYLYYYVNGKRYTKKIQNVQYNKTNYFQIEINKNKIIVNNVYVIDIPTTQQGYMLYPYYGGIPKSPKDINIEIKYKIENV